MNRVYSVFLTLQVALVTSTIFLLYISFFDLDPYIFLDFGLKKSIWAGILMFIPLVLFFLYKTRNSVRKHLLITSTLILLLPGCILGGSFFIYQLNIGLDNSPAYISVEEISTQKVRYGKSRRYYLNIKQPQNEYLAGNISFRISYNKYYKLPAQGRVKLAIRQGYFNMPYMEIKEKL